MQLDNRVTKRTNTILIHKGEIMMTRSIKILADLSFEASKFLLK
jgi:hypothetical protein